MKQIIYLFALALLLAGCSDDVGKEVETPTSSEETQTNNDLDEDLGEDNPDEGGNKELERSMTLIPPALDEMAQWNSFIATSSSIGEFQDASFNYEHTMYMQYIADPRTVFAEVSQPDMMIQTVNYYGSDHGHDFVTAYQNYDTDGYVEVDPNNGILKDHLKFRYELLSFAHEHGLKREASSDSTHLTETMTIPADYYEDFAILLREILEIEAIYNLDYKTDYKEVLVSIIMEGINLYGYTIHIEYPEDDIDGASSFTFSESFESVNEIEYINPPFAG